MALTVDPIKIDGLRDLQAGLRAADGESQKQIRLVLNDAADIVVGHARPLIARRTGKLAASLKAASGQRDATVKLGGARIPYAGWWEFGGRVGRRRSIVRRFVPAGRTVYPAVVSREPEITRVMVTGLDRLAAEAGL